MAYVTTRTPATNMAVFVDPLNGTPIPFAYARTTVADGNGRGLSPASVDAAPPSELDRRASSVSYFDSNSTRVPDPTRNANPGFVHFVNMEPREYITSAGTGATTMTPRAATVAVNAALPAGVDRRITITVANADGANVARLIPEEVQSKSFAPGYIPAQNDGTAIAVTGATFEVRNANIATAGQNNPNGFVRTDGSVEIVVQQADGVVRLIQHVILPTQAPRPFGVINIAELGINTGPNAKLIDTGAPSSGIGPGADGTIIGTATLNRFGQYFDFSPNGGATNPNFGRLTLIGPTNARVRAMRDNGIIFGVDGATTGLSRTAVNQEKAFGAIPQLQLNAATLLQAGAVADEAKGSVFRTLLTGSNSSYIDEAATGLTRAVDQMDAQSLGADPIVKSSKLFFSVDRGATGVAGTDVRVQSNRNQVAGDIFEISPNQAVPARNNKTNKLFINQEVMGLGPNYGPLVNAVNDANNPNDNLGSFDLDTAAAIVGAGMSNLDSPINRNNDNGTANRARVGGDRYATNFDLYFSLGGSPDILRSNKATTFAQGVAHIGLKADDDLDALALFRPSVAQGTIGGALAPGGTLAPNLMDARFDPNPMAEFEGIDAFKKGAGRTDLALFSLAPNSPSLAAFGLSAADIFITDFDGTFSLFGSAESLGLAMADNVDGLDSLIPEPTAMALLAAGAACLAAAASRRRRHTTVGAGPRA
jgi:hypothetical protein